MVGRNGQGPRVALYDRLSTATQAEDGYAGQGHLHELREHMAATGRVVVEEVTESDEKRHVYRRPGVQRLLQLAEAGEIQEVWAYRWDRYGKGSVPIRIEENLGDLGVKARALNDGGEGPGGRYFRAVDSVRGDIEQEEQAEKTKMGKRSKARAGKILGGGPRPRFGFAHVRNDKGKVISYKVVPGEMAVVRRILKELAAGRSIRSVQFGLEEDGIAAPRGGERWTRDTIKKIIREDTYRPYSPEELRALVAEGLLEAEVHEKLDTGKSYGINFYGRSRSRLVSRETDERVAKPAPRSEWIAIPVCLEGSGLDRAMVEAARRNIENNRATAKAGAREWWVLSRGFLFCGDCGRAMSAVATKDAKYKSEYHYYACPEPRSARRTAPSRCSNRRSYRAAELEREAALLFEDNAGRERLLELYDQAVREEEERMGGRGAAEKHETLSGELEALNAERKGYLKQSARGILSDSELDDLLSEVDQKREQITAELRVAEAAMTKTVAYSFVNAEWFEDPDAVLPSEWLTTTADIEQTRAAYRRYNVRFVVGAEGDLTMHMELPLGGPGDESAGGSLAAFKTTPR